MSDLTYCEECYENLDYDMFDSRFERPVCQECVYALDLEPELLEGAY
jgi:hypothetical protein